MKEPRQEHRRKLEAQGHQSAFTGNKEICHPWKTKGKYTKGDAGSFRHEEEDVDFFERAQPLLLQNRRRKVKGKVLREESPSGAVGCQAEDF